VTDVTPFSSAAKKRSMAGSGRAKLTMWEGGSLWVLETESAFDDMDYHAHHAVQLTCLLRGRQTLRLHGAQSSARIVAVDADVEHSLELNGLVALLFVDPDGASGRAIRNELFGSDQLAELPEQALAEEIADLAGAWASSAPSSAFEAIGRRFFDKLCARVAPQPPDARIERILAELERRLDQQPSLQQCAQGVYLSHSRLRHLFAEQTGLPFKSYALWRRLMRAVEAYAGGASLTEAAHAAGFADSAHFSRTFRRTFGVPATTLART
jgi:AraC-like DNA-binding protein